MVSGVFLWRNRFRVCYPSGMSNESKEALEGIQKVLEDRATAAFVEAGKAAGADNIADVFAQGKGQAYRDAAKLIAEFKQRAA